MTRNLLKWLIDYVYIIPVRFYVLSIIEIKFSNYWIHYYKNYNMYFWPPKYIKMAKIVTFVFMYTQKYINFFYYPKK